MFVRICARGARVHYAKDKDRPVVDPKSANEDSPGMALYLWTWAKKPMGNKKVHTAPAFPTPLLNPEP